MTDIALKDLVKDQTVYFSYYRDGDLWYEVGDSGFTFPVPISDTGTAMFKAQDKAILFMRYIRKQLDAIAKAKSTVDSDG